MKNSKIGIIIAVIVILCIAAGVGAAFYFNSKKENAEIQEDENSIKTISGIVIDATMSSITIKDNTNTIYTFSMENADKTDVVSHGIGIGDYATVTYFGRLDIFEDFQKVTVTKLAITEKQGTVANPGNNTNTIVENTVVENTVVANTEIETNTNTISNSKPSTETNGNQETTSNSNPGTNSNSNQNTEDTNKYNDNGIFKSYYDKAYSKMKSMTIDEKIGQLFLARVPESSKVEDVTTYHIGGYILFGRDTKNKSQDELKADIQSWQDAAWQSSNANVPLLIATDEEGGVVVRVSNNSNLAPSKFKSSQELYKEGGFEAIRNDTVTKNNLLDKYGINVNLAPVADVSTNSKDYIYSRAFGQNATKTAEFVKNVIESSKKTSVSDVLKHFPGYGNNVDTHTGIATDNRSLENFRKNDFLPFEAGIKAGAQAILVSHNIIVNVEDKIPASLSPRIHNILRTELGFTGIVMTDDLAMDAIKDYFSKPTVQALKAGNDMMIITDYKSGIQDLKDALNSGEISESLIDNACTRVLEWKYYKKMMQ